MRVGCSFQRVTPLRWCRQFHFTFHRQQQQHFQADQLAATPRSELDALLPGFTSLLQSLLAAAQPYQTLFGPGLHLYLDPAQRHRATAVPQLDEATNADPTRPHVGRERVPLHAVPFIPYLPPPPSGVLKQAPSPGELGNLWSLAAAAASLSAFYSHFALCCLASFATEATQTVLHSHVKQLSKPMPDFWRQVGTLNTFSGTNYYPRTAHQTPVLVPHPNTAAVEVSKTSHRLEHDIRVTLYTQRAKREGESSSGPAAHPAGASTLVQNTLTAASAATWSTPSLGAASGIGASPHYEVLSTWILTGPKGKGYVEESPVTSSLPATMPVSHFLKQQHASRRESETGKISPQAWRRALRAREAALLNCFAVSRSEESSSRRLEVEWLRGVDTCLEGGLLPMEAHRGEETTEASTSRSVFLRCLPSGGFEATGGYASPDGSEVGPEDVVPPWVLLSTLSEMCHVLDWEGHLPLRSRHPKSRYLWWLSAFQYQLLGDIAVGKRFTVTCAVPKYTSPFRVAPWRAEVGCPPPRLPPSPAGEDACVALRAEIRQHGSGTNTVALRGTFYFHPVADVTA